ncbi:glycosyltransferase family 4 protein [Flavobacterium sp.]|jgi:glycosyltransferase involved in cell wall biosynthesis|uniref:glycosyltransferase family 4 protein n=1 Tax=Flavobacterium sp. TaxID=239 RepID=UPI0037C16CAB
MLVDLSKLPLTTNTIIVGEESLKEQSVSISMTSPGSGSSSWWKPSVNGKKRIMLCGTYPIGTSNGYSKVVYYISKYLGVYDDIELTIYGFQNFANTSGANIRNDIPSRVKIHDAMTQENPRRNGFGELEIGKFIKENPQDVIIIFNDNIITSALTQTIINECGDQKRNFRLVSYMDQVYPYQKKNYIELLNTYFDAVIAFTPYWEGIARKLGIKESMPMFHFPHGFDTKLYYPIPTNIARLYFGYDENAFMVLNLNRNQPRKRWDTTIIAWAEFVERHYQSNVKNNNKLDDNTTFKTNKHTRRPIKLIVGTMMDGYWDLMDVFENEIKFRDVPWEYAKTTIEGVKAPQQLSDRDINILYNSCDVGLNTSDGEGFGLCVSDSAGLGKTQIVSYIGGMKEFLNNQIATVIESKVSIYLDNKSNGIGGKAELTDPHEYAEAFWKYFSNPELLEKHGIRARKHMLTHYRWETLVEYFYKNVVPKL